MDDDLKVYRLVFNLAEDGAKELFDKLDKALEEQPDRLEIDLLRKSLVSVGTWKICGNMVFCLIQKRRRHFRIASNRHRQRSKYS